MDAHEKKEIKSAYERIIKPPEKLRTFLINPDTSEPVTMSEVIQEPLEKSLMMLFDLLGLPRMNEFAQPVMAGASGFLTNYFAYPHKFPIGSGHVVEVPQNVTLRSGYLQTLRQIFTSLSNTPQAEIAKDYPDDTSVVVLTMAVVENEVNNLNKKCCTATAEARATATKEMELQTATTMRANAYTSPGGGRGLGRGRGDSGGRIPRAGRRERTGEMQAATAANQAALAAAAAAANTGQVPDVTATARGGAGRGRGAGAELLAAATARGRGAGRGAPPGQG